mmetsp:Transcript_49214/g.123340  ORF Transcript_49214/g.123340 Transcript_49214/m.123340 type:complete len:92 (-) Transcript_49214:392-667(-)
MHAFTCRKKILASRGLGQKGTQAIKKDTGALVGRPHGQIMDEESQKSEGREGRGDESRPAENSNTHISTHTPTHPLRWKKTPKGALLENDV